MFSSNEIRQHFRGFRALTSTEPASVVTVYPRSMLHRRTEKNPATAITLGRVLRVEREGRTAH
jgi:hypothetical protein